MIKIIKNSWALFTGFGIIVVSHGFQSNLLGIRSVIENFNFKIGRASCRERV